MNRLYEPGDRLEKWLVTGRHVGSWGVVYVLRDLDYREGLARPETVIGKVLRPEFADDAELRARFEEECYLWLSLGSYKHIVRLFSVDRLAGQPIAIGEYVPQAAFPHTLRGWLDHNLVEPESALRFAVHIVRGLKFARGRGLLVHQDLRPENVMVTGSGVAKVTDWGLSRMVPAEVTAPPASGSAPYRPMVARRLERHGTRGYAAPELLQSDAEPTAQADVFSLAVLFVEMLSGRRPMAGVGAAELEPSLRPVEARSRLAGLLASCLSERPQDRPESAADLEEPLAEAFVELVGVPVGRDPGPPEDAPTDLAQRAYGMFMLGKLDEALDLHGQVFGRDGGHTAVLMDYKEHGTRLVVPQEYLAETEQEALRTPDDPEGFDRASNLHLVAGSLDRALDLCRIWMRRHPDDVRAPIRAAEVRAARDDWRGALDHLDRALVLEPSAELWARHGEYSASAGDVDGALRSFEQAVGLDPAHAKANIGLGHLWMENGDARRAVKRFSAATEADPGNALAWYNLGVARRALRMSEEARAAMSRAVELDPEHAYALNALGVMAIDRDRLREAVEYFLRAIDASPRYARPWFNLAQVYEATDQAAKARDAYRRVLEIDPGHGRARTFLERLDASGGT